MRKEVIITEESGQGTIEYALIFAILSILGIAGWGEVGKSVLDMLTEVANSF